MYRESNPSFNYQDIYYTRSPRWMLNLDADLHFSPVYGSTYKFSTLRAFTRRTTHTRAVRMYASCTYLLFMLLFSLNVFHEFSASTRARADGSARVPAGFIMANAPRVRPHMRERAYARLHTDTRECARAITHEPPRSSSARNPPARAAIVHIITAREGAIINLGITPQTYMPRRAPSWDTPFRGEGFYLWKATLESEKKRGKHDLMAQFASRLKERTKVEYRIDAGFRIQKLHRKKLMSN